MTEITQETKVEIIPEWIKTIKPVFGKAVIKAIEKTSVAHLVDKLKGKVGTEMFNKAQAAGLILDDPEIFRESEKQHTGEINKNTGEKIVHTVLGKRRTDAHVPICQGRVLKKSPDFWGFKLRGNNGPDVGEGPEVGDVVWFIPNETYVLDTNREYHLVNDCDIVAFEKADEVNHKYKDNTIKGE